MKIYPPYKTWKVTITNPEKFKQYLLENIEYNNSNHNAVLKGKFQGNKFIVERKLFYYNTNRPQIKGVIETLNEGKQVLSLSIESSNSLLYIVSAFSILIIITAVFQVKPFVLFGIPVMVVWFYIGGLILHNIELKKTKAELNKIIQQARKS